MTTEERIIVRGAPRRSAGWGKRALWGILLLAVIGGIALAVQRASIWWTMGRARSFSAEATRLFETGQPDQAMAVLLQAWQMAPRDTDIMREVARRFEEIPARASDAASVWRKIVSGPAATADDQLRLAGALVKISDATAARIVLEGLPADVRQRPGCLEIEADLLMIEGREQESEKLLRIALERSPHDPLARLRLAKMQMTSVFAAVRDEARRVLWELGHGGGKTASKALLALSSLQLSGSEIADAREIVSSNSDISSTDRLAILTACARQQPALADDLVLEESRRVEGKRPENCPEFYTWLAQLGKAEKILQDLSEKREAQAPGSAGVPAVTTVVIEPKTAVLESRELFLAYGDALILKGDWKSFSTLLKRRALPIGREDAALMLAMCANGMGEPVEVVDGHLATALSFARNTKDSFELVRVADQAERLDRPQLALQALLSLPPSNKYKRQELLQRTYRLQKSLGTTDDLLVTADAILEARPELVPYADEAVYLRLLTGRDIERVLHSFSPERKDVAGGISPLRRLVWALSAYQCGSIDDARRWLDGMDGSGLAVGQRAVIAGLLKATGREADAYRIAEKIPPAAISPEEGWFLKVALH